MWDQKPRLCAAGGWHGAAAAGTKALLFCAPAFPTEPAARQAPRQSVSEPTACAGSFQLQTFPPVFCPLQLSSLSPTAAHCSHFSTKTRHKAGPGMKSHFSDAIRFSCWDEK